MQIDLSLALSPCSAVCILQVPAIGRMAGNSEVFPILRRQELHLGSSSLDGCRENNLFLALRKIYIYISPMLILWARQFMILRQVREWQAK